MVQHGQLYALLIGINDYECETIRKLQFAVTDVVAFHAILGQRLQLREENCILLTHPSAGAGSIPRRADVLRALAQFSKAPMGPDDTFLLYFAGHGFAAADKSYLLTVDSDPALPELLAESAVSLETVTRFTRQVTAGQHLLILDACRNNPTTLGRSTGTACLDTAMARDIVTLAQSPSAGAGPHLPARAILSACWEGQVSYEYPAQSHGWFSYNLLESLRSYSSELLDLSEMAEQVRERMRGRAWRELPQAVGQEPHVVIEGRPVRLRLSSPQGTPTAATPSVSALSALAQEPQPVAPPPQIVVPEAIDDAPRLPCPACGKVLRPNPSVAGKELPCPACTTMLKVAPDLQQLTVMKVAGPSTPVGNVEVGRKMPAVVGPLSVITNEIGMKLVLIPAGEFLMGSKRGLLNRIRGVGRDESPPHRVRITKPFYLGVTPVTQAEYQQVMGTNPSYFSAHGGEKEKVAGMDTSRFPVENVSWEEAVEFCRRLSQQEGKQYGLPTEAEWEYACRAGSRMRYCFGDDKRELGEYAWFDANSRAMVQPVGQKKPNAWGLYDMHGHICEWCADRYDERYYANSPTDDPTGPTTGSHRALRGSCWFDSASECHSANRSLRSPEDRHSYLGFRVARVIAE